MIKQEVPRILGPSLRDPYSTVESPGLCLAVALTPTITPNTIIFPRGCLPPLCLQTAATLCVEFGLLAPSVPAWQKHLPSCCPGWNP